MRNAFVDSNVLVYAADESPGSSRKREIARKLLRTPDLRISVQVLSEFVASARNPGKLDLSREAENDWLTAWLALSVADLTPALFLEAVRIHRAHQLSHWDSLILATALSLNCPVLYSEDMQHGRVIEGLKILKPFREGA
jgi:predicted nucleic acid-binding protein